MADKTLKKSERKRLKTPDAFVKWGRQFISFLAEQKTQFVPIFIALVVIVAGVYAYEVFSSKQSGKAWNEFYEASKKPDAERWEALKKVHQDRSNTRAGYLAAVKLGDHFFELAQAENAKPDMAGKEAASAQSAEEWYAKGLQFSSLIPSERLLLTLNHSQALELRRKFDEAIAGYQKASEISGADGKGLSVIYLGLAYEQKGDVAKAKETFDKAAVDFASGEYGRIAKMHSRRLKSGLLKDANW